MASKRTQRKADEDSPILGVARQMRAWSDSALGIAGVAADVSAFRGAKKRTRD